MYIYASLTIFDVFCTVQDRPEKLGGGAKGEERCDFEVNGHDWPYLLSPAISGTVQDRPEKWADGRPIRHSKLIGDVVIDRTHNNTPSSLPSRNIATATVPSLFANNSVLDHEPNSAVPPRPSITGVVINYCTLVQPPPAASNDDDDDDYSSSSRFSVFASGQSPDGRYL
ncbi:hypothetical protein BS47DRAFT_1361258 [Hydnum rufescens UP504]|uniref:Uncharacterized protein n=1 Tax=Hydnum rufescens UP504 TaxID=1448309 RepID=A0A9P6DVC4_9AGAM|nr:hypothetical protein BS47DRAFT_1361258 [Hydnum rufescens UP504]